MKIILVSSVFSFIYHFCLAKMALQKEFMFYTKKNNLDSLEGILLIINSIISLYNACQHGVSCNNLSNFGLWRNIVNHAFHIKHKLTSTHFLLEFFFG